MTGAYLAVDGGNSKTVALVVDGAGAVLGRGRGGNGDLSGASSEEAARAAVTGAATDALQAAGVRPEELTCAAFRLAGVDWPEDAADWRGWVAQALPGLARFTVANDGVAALRLGRADGVGIGLTLGTGPALAARGRSGDVAWAGWWVIDDLGGGGLARTALRAVYRAWMGLAEPTALTDALLELLGAPDVPTLHHQLTRRHGRRPAAQTWVAARTVLRLAAEGDAVAGEIVAEQARTVVGYAGWLARQVGEDLVAGQVPVVLAGSVLTSEHGGLRAAVLEELAAAAPAAPRVLVAGGSPLAGCVLDALAEGGVELDDALVGRVVGAEHPAEFLMT